MAYCSRCNRSFPHKSALAQHKRDSGNHYNCYDCNKDFTTWTSLQQHYVQSRRHFYCQICDRYFNSENGRANHCASKHNQCVKRRTVGCPGHKCSKAFVSASALVMHAESGACPSGVTRQTVNTFVAILDHQNIITNPARMITGPGGWPHVPAEPVYWAAEQSWNGRAYECFLCRSEFRQLHSLDAHLKSPRHLERIYRCPGCRKEFTVLSALGQHVESGSCGIKIRAQSALERLTRAMRSIGF